MKKLLTLALMAIAISAQAQLAPNDDCRHLNTYGGKGQLYLEENAEGMADYKEVIDCPGQAPEEIKKAVRLWITAMQKRYHMSVSDLTEIGDMLAFRAEVEISNDLMGTPAMPTTARALSDKAEGEMEMTIVIEVKEGRFRYHVYEIVSDRCRLHGDAESEGAINDLHWQRVNCLNNELKACRNESMKKRLEAQIEQEWQVYEIEAAVVKDLIRELTICTVKAADDDNW